MDIASAAQAQQLLPQQDMGLPLGQRVVDTGADKVYATASSMAAETLNDLDSMARSKISLNNAKYQLSRLDDLRKDCIAAAGEKRGLEIFEAIKGQHEMTIQLIEGPAPGSASVTATPRPDPAAALQASLDPALAITGRLFETAEDGRIVLGRFTIEGGGDGMGMRLDSETGLTLKERGGEWTGDGGVAARVLANLRAVFDAQRAPVEDLFGTGSTTYDAASTALRVLSTGAALDRHA